jgi:hypothetical protein
VGQVSYKGLSFTLSDSQDKPSFFVLGVRKSGSSVLNKMVRALAQRQGLPFVDVPDRLFQAGMSARDWQHDPTLINIIGGGNVYGGFRNHPVCLNTHPAFLACRKVLLVRDPRDALISQYFSNAYSHAVPDGGLGRDRFLEMRREALETSVVAYAQKQARHMAGTLMEYAPLLSDPLLKLYRYEDIITRKRAMLESISEHFGWPINEKHVDAILRWADVFPDAERPTEFIRRVTPGDHREKLSADSIAYLNKVLAEPLRLYGYTD